MFILAVETATNVQSLAVLDEKRVLAHHTQEGLCSQTQSLIPAIDQLLSSISFPISQLQGLAVSIGPGSFTGLRVGLAAMLGFRVTLNIPLVTVSTLEAMAWNFSDSELPLCPILRARTGEVYWACFHWEGEKLVRRFDDRVGSCGDLLKSLSGPTLVFGDGWVVNRDEFVQLSDMLIEPSSGNGNACAVSVGIASLSRFHEGIFAGQGVAPHYVQRSYAEIHSLGQKKGSAT